MKFHIYRFLLFIFLIATTARAEESVLTFLRKIGVNANDAWNGWMSFVAFSPDGTVVASDGPANPQDSSGGLTMWTFPEGQFIKSIPFRPQAISYDWNYYTSDHGVISVQSGRVLANLGGTKFRWANSAFSFDSRLVAFSGEPSGKRSHTEQIHISRLVDGTVISKFGTRAVFSLAFSPENSVVASGHWDNVTLWHWVTGERIALLKGFERYVVGISFSPDGKLLAAGTDLGGLQIWDVAANTLLHSINLKGGDVSTPAFSPDGSLVAAGVYGTGKVFVVDVLTGAIVGEARVSGLGCGSVAFSPDGRYLITPSTGGLITWPYDRAGTIRVFEVQPGVRR
jgi:WD40 repeat protein